MFLTQWGFGQGDVADSTSNIYKKRVLESTELDILTSFYTQDGNNAAVTGGIGSEKLNDFATNISIAIPLNEDDILRIDGTVSAYTSASSSNLNPFSGASSGGEEDDDDHDGGGNTVSGPITGSPWVASSGASRSDTWTNLNGSYSHTSDDRNKIWNANMSMAHEYDYSSFGFGGGYNQLFNQKNTELGIQGNIYLDKWRPQYPTEVKTYIHNDGNLYQDFFNGVNILDQNGNIINKSASDAWSVFNTTLPTDVKRNSYSVSVSFSQILSKKMQISVFGDIVLQKGLLANPMQRVYFGDRDNFYIGNASSIPFYTSRSNTDVFQLADDIERLPNTRLKVPIGTRLNYFINEFIVLRTYYRYYQDSWDLKAHTVNVEIPIKFMPKFTLYPAFRYYVQDAVKYFAPYERHLSSVKYYTSDFDLSNFHSSQYSLGIKYTDVFTTGHIGALKIKTASLTYSYYFRSTGLVAHIVSLGVKFIID